MTPTIRRARHDEARALSALGAETFTATFGHLYSRENLQKFLAKNHSPAAYERLLSDDSSAVWVVEEEGSGALKGYAAAGPCTLPAPDMPENSGELLRLYLTKGVQGTGLGSGLLKAALGFLRDRHSTIYLSVYRDNLVAQRLYERHGFVKIHEYFYMVGDHADPEFIMRLDRR